MFIYAMAGGFQNTAFLKIGNEKSSFSF